MKIYQAVVKGGRLVLDEPTGLSEGTEVPLVPADTYTNLDGEDPFADMPDEDRQRLHVSLEKSERELAAGQGVPAEEVLQELKAPR